MEETERTHCLPVLRKTEAEDGRENQRVEEQMIMVTNSLSVNMMRRSGENLHIHMTSRDEVKNLLSTERWISRVGRKDLALLASADLEEDIKQDKRPIKMRTGDIVIVCQFVGPKIESNGALEIDASSRVEYWLVKVL